MEFNEHSVHETSFDTSPPAANPTPGAALLNYLLRTTGV